MEINFDKLIREISAFEVAKAVADVIKDINNKHKLQDGMDDIFAMFGAKVIAKLFDENNLN